MKDSFRSFLFVVTACHNGREASLPEKGATEATSCPKGGNMWRHWYGLAQAWGSTTYDWTLGQILPRSREGGCQQNLTEALSQGRHGFTVRETLPWKNTHMGLTGDPGELTPVLGLASDCSAQSDCRGCLEVSTRVHHPGNWTGGEKGARIPGWGGMAQQAWHRPVLPAHYLPNTREETGSTRRL